MSQSDEHRPKISRFGTTDFVILGYRFPILGSLRGVGRWKKGAKKPRSRGGRATERKKGGNNLLEVMKSRKHLFFRRRNFIQVFFTEPVSSNSL